MLAKFSFWLLFILVFNSIFGQNLVEITDNTEEIALTGEYVAIYEDSDNQDLTQILKNAKFRAIAGQIPNINDLNNSIWIKSRIKNSTEKKNFLLEVPDHRIDSLEIHIISKDYSQSFKAGDLLPYYSRTFLHKNFEFFLPDTLSEFEIYFKAKAKHAVFPFLLIRSEKKFIDYSLNEYASLGFFYGMIIMMAIFNLILFLRTKETTRLIYTCYIVSACWFLSCQDGFGFQYIWYNYPVFNNYSLALSIYCVSFFNLLYTKYFLKNSSIGNQVSKVVTGLIIARTILFLLSLTLFPDIKFWLFIDLFPLFFSLLAGIKAVIKGYLPARYYTVGFAFLVVGFMVHTLKNFGLLKNDIFKVYSTNAGFLLEIIFLAIAISDQYRFQVKEKEKAKELVMEELKKKELYKGKLVEELKNKKDIQEEINRQLEQKVREKTTELKESNLQLIETKKEVDRINSLLDNQNYYLNKHVKEIQKDILTDKALEKISFQQVFESKDKCDRYLSELKWGENARENCINCKRGQLTDGSKRFSKRCIVCNKVETTTSGTLFHALKIPLNKAFHILHLHLHHPENTNANLALQLDLPVKTIWSFRTKIKEREEKLLSIGVKPSFDKVIIHSEKPKRSLKENKDSVE